MKPFTRNELIITSIILLLIGSVTFYNIRIAERRARDSTRQSDLGAVSNALNKFHDDFGYFPPAVNGQIKACRGENFDAILDELQTLPMFDRNKYLEGLRPCVWGEDEFDDLIDDTYEPYMRSLPRDPGHNNGISYYYISNQTRYQIYAYLEGEDNEDAHDRGIADRNLSCGEKVCNFGKAYGETPLNISIEEYEEILEKERLEKLKNP